MSCFPLLALIGPLGDALSDLQGFSDAPRACKRSSGAVRNGWLCWATSTGPAGPDQVWR